MDILNHLKYKTCLIYCTLFGLIHLSYVSIHSYDALSDTYNVINGDENGRKLLNQKIVSQPLTSSVV